MCRWVVMCAHGLSGKVLQETEKSGAGVDIDPPPAMTHSFIAGHVQVWACAWLLVLMCVWESIFTWVDVQYRPICVQNFNYHQGGCIFASSFGWNWLLLMAQSQWEMQKKFKLKYKLVTVHWIKQRTLDQTVTPINRRDCVWEGGGCIQKGKQILSWFCIIPCGAEGMVLPRTQLLHWSAHGCGKLGVN